jgi:catechol 2,3-dioxygenase-like lactoylglutathione lyase family enzyme
MRLIVFYVALLVSTQAISQEDKAMQPSALSQVRPYAVTMSVPDIEAGITWYTEKLGFKVVKMWVTHTSFHIRLQHGRRGAAAIGMGADVRRERGRWPNMPTLRHFATDVASLGPPILGAG